MKWHFVRQWFYENDFGHGKWTHHMARFGVNVPVFLTQAIFGRVARIYYVLPVLAFTIQMLGVYALGRRLGGRAGGVVSAILLMLFTGLDRAASQLLPDGITATAMIIVCYCLVRHHEGADSKRVRWLVGAGLSFAWAYSIKESNLLFVPGLLAAVWLSTRRFRDVLIFAAAPVLAVAIETAAFRLLTDYASRMAIVQEAHGEETSTFFELFNRFTSLPPAWQMLLWMWVPSALGLLALPDARLRTLLVIPATFIFLLTFLVRRVDPIVLWTRFQSRYFEPVAPLLALAVGLFVVEALRRAYLIQPAKSWLALAARGGRHAGLVTALLCSALGLVQYWIYHEDLKEHPLERLRLHTGITNDAYRRNLPIIQRGRGNRDERWIRPMRLVYGVYLKDKYLAKSDVAKDGRLPDINEGIRESGRYAYILRDVSAYAEGDLERLIDTGCAVRITDRRMTLIVENEGKLPENCEAPDSEVLPY